MSTSIQDKAEKIEALRARLGASVTIMGHHYQHETVIRHCDVRGDSLGLARRAAEVPSEHIVFCGVYFMGESAALLVQPEQKVYLPEPSADCVMALMSPATLLEHILKKLTADGRKLIPLAYVNTSLDVKAVVGRYNGAVCTSANARQMLEWAMKAGDGVLFVPDKNLAQNTAAQLGISPQAMHMLDIRKRGEAVDMEAARKASLLLWPGLCAIHARFNAQHIAALRKKHPGCRIVVHPECSPEIVQAADASGSTSFIIDYAAAMPDNSVLGVGTEINQVRRLAAQHKERGLTIVPLKVSACSHMASVTPAKLCRALEHIVAGKATPIRIEPHIVEPARATLTRMFEVCA